MNYIETQKRFWQSKVIEAALALTKVPLVELQGDEEGKTREVLANGFTYLLDEAATKYVEAIQALQEQND